MSSEAGIRTILPLTVVTIAVLVWIAKSIAAFLARLIAKYEPDMSGSGELRISGVGIIISSLEQSFLIQLNHHQATPTILQLFDTLGDSLILLDSAYE